MRGQLDPVLAEAASQIADEEIVRRVLEGEGQRRCRTLQEVELLLSEGPRLPEAVRQQDAEARDGKIHQECQVVDYRKMKPERGVAPRPPPGVGLQLGLNVPDEVHGRIGSIHADEMADTVEAGGAEKQSLRGRGNRSVNA